MQLQVGPCHLLRGVEVNFAPLPLGRLPWLVVASDRICSGIQTSVPGNILVSLYGTTTLAYMAATTTDSGQCAFRLTLDLAPVRYGTTLRQDTQLTGSLRRALATLNPGHIAAPCYGLSFAVSGTAAKKEKDCNT